MVRRCSVAGCNSTAGLHSFPADLKIRRQWLHALGLEDREFPPRAGVCKLHFTRDCFSNAMEVEMGFSTQLALKRDAVPYAAPPARTPPPQRRLAPTMTREIGCQTEPVSSMYAGVQVNMKPMRRSKATQSRVANGTCDTGTPMEPFTECPGATSTPVKRKRCEVSTDDSSYHQDGSESSMNCTRVSNEVLHHKVTKYIVYEDKLLELFRRCPVCTRSVVVSQTIIGTLLRVKQHCAYCEYSSDWSSQPMVNNIPAGNLQLCAAVLFTGSSFCQISKFLDAFKIQGISESCFNKHQAKLLIPTINWQWKIDQDDAIENAIANGAVTLGGDMRADSPAKYGSYTMMDLKANRVIDIQLVQSNEVGNHQQMEMEGFERSLSLLEERGVVVQSLVTDRHTGVQKFMREQKKDISHFFDLWHMGKGLGKKMDVLSKGKGLQDVGLWRKSVVNHLYWSATTSTTGEEIVAKWSSVANHIQNIHSHENTLFPSCLHEPLVGDQTRHWLKPSTAACEKFTAILLSPRLLKDLHKISPEYHTSGIECFHSLILKFSPKNTVFSFKEMLCRLQLAAMHYNENAGRSQASTADGDLRYSIVFPKFKHGEFMVRALKSNPTTGYIDKLMELLFHHVVEEPQPYLDFSGQMAVPEKLCAQFIRPDKEEAVSRHGSRIFKIT
uniref:THAP-type domain-containing protein n=1 Tax=Cyprinus carpio carpio TaxID=630221 RepID=A0A9J8A9J5_CYPCA